MSKSFVQIKHNSLIGVIHIIKFTRFSYMNYIKWNYSSYCQKTSNLEKLGLHTAGFKLSSTLPSIMNWYLNVCTFPTLVQSEAFPNVFYVAKNC